MQFEIPSDVVDDRLSLGDIRVRRLAHRFKAHALEATHGFLDGQAVLDRERKRPAEALNQARQGRAFLGHFDEDFPGRSVGVQADGQVAFVAHDVELMGDRIPDRR